MKGCSISNPQSPAFTRAVEHAAATASERAQSGARPRLPIRVGCGGMPLDCKVADRNGVSEYLQSGKVLY